MALFAPTNVTPSLIGQLGNGTVDILNGIDVSWQVNGNTPMTAFEINIYANDAASTFLYSTGKKTDNCPFHGKDGLGNYRQFSFSISSADLISAGVANGNEYKLIVTQWWSDNDYIVQPSASAFNTRETPVLTIGALPAPLDSNKHTFSAIYSQAQGDVLNWVRWQIANADDLNEPFFDTQDIYGTAELQISYDGFFTGNRYAIKCTVQTVNGITATTDWQYFDVEYEVSTVTGLVATQCLRDKSAVSISWPGIYDIPGMPDGEYSIYDEVLTLKEGSSVTWNTVNDGQLKFDAKWSVLWSGSLSNTTSSLLNLATSEGNLTFKYSYSHETLTLLLDDEIIFSQGDVKGDARVGLILTPNKAYLRVESSADYLVPSEDLLPSDSLYPSSGVNTVLKTVYDVEYPQGYIYEINVSATGGLYDPNSNMIIEDVDELTDYANSLSYEDGYAQVELTETDTENPAQLTIEDKNTDTTYAYGISIDEGETNMNISVLEGDAPDDMAIENNDSDETYSYELSVDDGNLHMAMSYVEQMDADEIGFSVDFIEIISGEPSQETIDELYGSGLYNPIIESNNYFLADFVSSLGAGTAGSVGQITGYSIYRQQGETGRLIFLANISSDYRGVLDYGVANLQGPYTYYIIPHTEEGFVTAPYISQKVYPCWWDWSVLECEETAEGYFDVIAEYRFGKNLKSGTITNNNAPHIVKNFTRYPTVQISPSNYQSGTLQSLIGAVGFNDNGEYKYSDTTQLRDGIYQLATTTNALFLRNRKGDVMRIRVSGAIGMSTFDESVEQALTVSLPWCEIGDAKQTAIISAF